MSNATETYGGISGGVWFLAGWIGESVDGSFGAAMPRLFKLKNQCVLANAQAKLKSKESDHDFF